MDIEKGTLNGVPAVMAGFWGSHLGQIDLTLQRSGNDFKVVGHTVGTIPILRREDGKAISTAEPKAEMLAAIQPDHEATLEYVRRPVGRTARAMDSFFAMVADNAAMQTISDAQIWYARQLLAGGPTRRCRSSRRSPPSRRAVVAVRNSTRRCRKARWRSSMSPTSISIPTRSRR